MFETVQKPVAVPRERVVFVDRILSRVDVDAHAQLPREIDATRERLAVERETGVRPDEPGKLPVASLLTQANVPLVLRQPLAGLCLAIAASHFVAHHGPTTDRCDPFL